MRASLRPVLAALLTAAIVASGASARAQSIPSPPASAPSAADAATAKRHFESGLKLFGEGAYAEALIAFESSYKLGGRPSALRNIAQCHRNLRHVVEAYEAYEQMLALHEAQLSPADKTSVRQALEELGLLTVTVSIDVDQSGALIEIDGKPAGQSPLGKPKRVMVGDHRLRVTKAGFEPFEKSLETRSGKDEKVEVVLAPEKTTGRLVVREQRGREVHVFVDDVDRGPAPWEGDVDAGDHAIELKGPKFASEKRSARVARKERVDLALEATPLDGKLRVTTLPASARIEVDGKAVGTGAWEGDVSPGSHAIVVTVAGAPPVVRQVRIERGETIAQEIPVVTAVSAPPDYRGVFVRLTAFPGFWLNAKPENATGASSVDKGAHIGLAGALRIGYSLDPIAIELVGSFMFEHRDENLNYPNGSTKYDMNGPNIFVGAGARVTSRDPLVRFTFGLAPGVSFRSFNVNSSQNNNPQPSCNTGPGSPPCSSSGGDQGIGSPAYTTFGLMADGGMLVGTTPGTKFFLGVHALVDFPPNDVMAGPDTRTPAQFLASPGAGYRVANGGVQLVVGPVLGIQFGE